MIKVKMTPITRSPKRTLDDLCKDAKVLEYGRAYKPYWVISCKVTVKTGLFWKKTIEAERNFLVDAVTSRFLFFKTIDLKEYLVPAKSLIKMKIDRESAFRKLGEFNKRFSMMRSAELKELKVISVDIIYRPIYVVILQDKRGDIEIKSFFCDEYKTQSSLKAW